MHRGASSDDSGAKRVFADIEAQIDQAAMHASPVQSTAADSLEVHRLGLC